MVIFLKTESTFPFQKLNLYINQKLLNIVHFNEILILIWTWMLCRFLNNAKQTGRRTGKGDGQIDR